MEVPVKKTKTPAPVAKKNKNVVIKKTKAPTTQPSADGNAKVVKAKTVIKKPLVSKIAPKKKVIVKKNTTKKCVPKVENNQTKEISDDTDIADKKNKIEYLENLEKDLDEARAKITK